MGEESISLLLRAGVLTAAALMLAGAALGEHVTRAGIIVLMATPVLRVAATALLFFKNGDRALAGLALIVLAVLLAGVTGS